MACCRRFIPVLQDAADNSVTNGSPTNAIPAVESISNHDTKGCSVCLGVLQTDFLQQTTTEIIDHLKSQKYNINDFLLCVSLPQAFRLRQVSFSLFAEKNDEVIIDDDLKNTFKTKIADLISKQNGMAESKSSHLSITVNIAYDSDRKEISKLTTLLPSTGNQRKRKHKHIDRFNSAQNHPLDSLENVNSAIDRLTVDNVDTFVLCPPMTLTNKCLTTKISMKSESTYLAGRYNKYDRQLSQTPWFIDGQNKTEDSVSDLICDRLKLSAGATDVKFLSSGREDVDVRMLGSGRPFAVELVDPKDMRELANNMSKFETEINEATKKVAVRSLQIIDKSDLTVLKEGEETKVKEYRAKIWSKGPLPLETINKINSLKELVIHQNTPLRVLHRRPLINRPRTIHSMFIELAKESPHDMEEQSTEMGSTDVKQSTDEQTVKHETTEEGTAELTKYYIDLKTQAGTYIKEFVHGDFGRTEPSLGSLVGQECDIILLDVTDVQLEWPPK